MRHFPSIVTLILFSVLGPVHAASGQFLDPDPDALAALEKMAQAYRERPALTVTSSINVEIEKDGHVADGREFQATFHFASAPAPGNGRAGAGAAAGAGDRPAARLHWRDMTIFVTGGEVTAFHDDNDGAYFRMTDDGSPYYALLAMFMDLPFPHLALAFGEEDPLDLCMQLHSRAPWIRPTGLEDIRRDDQPVRIIMFTSEFERMEMVIDPETQLIQTVELEILGGQLVEAGTILRYTHSFEYELPEREELLAMMQVDLGERSRVDRLVALRPRREAPAAGERRGVVAGDVIGEPAPNFELETFDGELVSLEELEGRVIVLDFWATWCRPCVHTLPMLHEIQQWIDEERLPVRIYAVNVWENADQGEAAIISRRESAQRFWDERDFTLPVLMDYTDAAAAAYNVQGIPTAVIIRADGVVHTLHVGVIDDYVERFKKDIEEAIRALEF